MSDKLEIDLNPKKVLDSLKDISKGTEQLAQDIEKGLGKDAPKSIGRLEEASEKGTNKITAMFRNMGTRVKEDLKTAFDATGIMAGAKFAKTIADGVKQVFEMEKAFGKLNARLGLTAQQMEQFKKSLGRQVASTGQSLQDILPGVDVAAAKGRIKSPQQLANIGEALGQAHAITGEDTSALSDTVIEILRKQGKQITDQSFKATLDALESTKSAGGFGTAGEAGHAIESLSGAISPQKAREMGLGTKEMGGLAAAANRGGEHGEQIIEQIIKTAATAGGKGLLNQLLGVDLFKNGKMNIGALGQIKPERMGKFGEQIMGEAAGVDQADFARFVQSMKEGQGDIAEVLDGLNGTASQFSEATDNWASQVDMFKARMKQIGVEFGQGFASFAKDLKDMNFSGAFKDVKSLGTTAMEHKGDLAVAALTTGTAATLFGGAFNSLLKKVGGKGGAAVGNAVTAQAMKAAGITPVYVVNYDQVGKASAVGLMGGNSSGGIFGEGPEGMLPGGKNPKGVLGGGGKGANIIQGVQVAISVAAAAEVGYEIGQALMSIPMFKKATNSAADYAADLLTQPGGSASRAEQEQMEKQRVRFNQSNGMAVSKADFQKAVHDGTLSALKAHHGSRPVSVTNPSALSPQGGGHN